MQHKRSLFSLVTFSASAALLAGLALGVLYAGMTVAFAVGHSIGATPSTLAHTSSQEPLAGQKADEENSVKTTTVASFSGLITDNLCGARHDMGSAQSASECARTCVRNGADYVLVNGDKKYVLVGNADELANLSGQRATVAGTLSGDKIIVSSVTSGP